MTDMDDESVRVLSTIIHMLDPQPVIIPNECFDLLARVLCEAYIAGRQDMREACWGCQQSDGFRRGLERAAEICDEMEGLEHAEIRVAQAIRYEMEKTDDC